VYGAAAAQASGFGDERRELKERRLEAAEAHKTRAEDERAAAIARELDTLD
jgi:hypothetical protein